MDAAISRIDSRTIINNTFLDSNVSEAFDVLISDYSTQNLDAHLMFGVWPVHNEGQLSETQFEQECESVLEPKAINDALESTLGPSRYGALWVPVALTLMYSVILLVGGIGNTSSLIATVSAVCTLYSTQELFASDEKCKR